MLIQQIVIFLVSYAFLKKNDLLYHNRVFLWMSVTGIFFQSMTSILPEMFRVSMYFSIANIILLSNALSSRTGADSVYLYCANKYLIFFGGFVIAPHGTLPDSAIFAPPRLGCTLSWSKVEYSRILSQSRSMTLFGSYRIKPLSTSCFLILLISLRSSPVFLWISSKAGVKPSA